MTEEEWLSGADLDAMLAFLDGRASERKLRLFACRYCRTVWKHITDRHTKGLIRLSEGKADTASSEAELSAMWHAHFARGFACGGRRPTPVTVYCSVLRQVDPAADQTRPSRSEKAISLLREIFGNPFRPVTFDPSWRTSDVMLLARGIYDEKAFDRMPILADALQDAGCDNDELLAHLRDATATHVRGCWALDLVLGKE
jgi:hypothetical protein